MELNEHTLFAIEIAREAGAELMRRFPQRHAVETKSTPIDLVTEADFASERILVERIRSRFPAHQILTEEGTAQGSLSADWLWVVDPLDGTVNYAHGFPVFSVSVALAHRGDVRSGAVYDPVRDIMFAAERGKGAWRDGKPIRVSKASTLGQAMLATGFPYDVATSPDNNVREFGHIVRKAQAVRRAGAASLDVSWVAAGVLDGYWEANLKPWDWAAGALLVEEAGGRVTDYDGAPWRIGRTRLVATNGLVHEALLGVLGEG